MPISQKILFLLMVPLMSCKTPGESGSSVKAGLGGEPSEWTCAELSTEYFNYRDELLVAINNFNLSFNSIKAQLSERDLRHSLTPEVTVSEDDSFEDGESKLGEGADRLPDLPPFIAGMNYMLVSGLYTKKVVAACDDHLGRFGQSTDKQILEQCRYIMQAYNILQDIKHEYNYGRYGECRSGRAALERSQVSTRYPYCDNPCRFGQTTCVKCTFSFGLISSQYICGEERDARVAIEQHCRNGSYACTGKSASCAEPKLYNDIQGGTTSIRQSDTKFEVKVNVNAKLEAEVNEVVTLRTHQETKMEVSIAGQVTLRNSRGQAILSVNGGETGTTYECSISVGAALIRDVGAAVGVGFDVVVASGSATAGVGANFSALQTFTTTSRRISAAGQNIINILEGCKKFALDWGTYTLPSLVTENVVVKAVASRFMGETKDELQVDTVSKNIFCLTNKPGLTTDNKTYRITKVVAGLVEKGITVQAHYDGKFNRFDGKTLKATLGTKELGQEKYVALRKIMFNEGPEKIPVSDLRLLLGSVNIDSRYRFSSCNKTSW